MHHVGSFWSEVTTFTHNGLDAKISFQQQLVSSTQRRPVLYHSQHQSIYEAVWRSCPTAFTCWIKKGRGERSRKESVDKKRKYSGENVGGLERLNTLANRSLLLHTSSSVSLSSSFFKLGNRWRNRRGRAFGMPSFGRQEILAHSTSSILGQTVS